MESDRRFSAADTLSIRRAEPDDLNAVMQLVADCIRAMRQAGIEQWDDIYPDRATLLADARERTLHLAWLHEDRLVGCLVLNDYQNPEYADVPWTIAGARIAVVHRLMVDPWFQGRGLARELMGFAERLATEGGCDVLRLDAFTANPRALRLYQGLGYHDAGSVTFRKGVFRCFEKRLGGA
ncbi:MAG TPA: GNAT family N-acetyltransferase [Vicinamibacterales bacterium]|nr:GNAT family N-acetyltransferase [Vicinamibacterales bacterium]